MRTSPEGEIKVRVMTAQGPYYCKVAGQAFVGVGSTGEGR